MSTFLALILSAIIIFNGVFIDLIRYDAAVSILDRTVNNAVISSMADYNGRLRDDYGLYAMYQSDKNAIRNTVLDYVRMNLDSQEKTGLYSDDVHSLRCEFATFKDLDILRRQIIEYVKYRVPGNVIEQLLRKAMAAGDVNFISETQNIELDISKCSDNIKEACGKYDESIREFNKFKDDFLKSDVYDYTDIIEKYDSLLVKAESALTNLFNVSNEVKARARELKNMLSSYKQRFPDKKAYFDSMERTTDETNNLIIGEAFYNDQMQHISNNRTIFNELNTAERQEDAMDDDYWKELCSIADGFKALNYSPCKEQPYSSENEKYDKRNDNAKAVKDMFSQDDEKSKEISSEMYSKLPSHYFRYNDPNRDNELKKPDQIDLNNEKSSKESLEYADNLFSKIKNDLSGLYEEILINEYILTTFKSAVLKNDKNEYYRDLKGTALVSRPTFLNNEVEYILHGKLKDNDNLFYVKAELYLFRFCMNTLHVYMDPNKKATAHAAALAVCALLGGAGSGLIANLIMWGWSAGESCIDLSDLMKGKSVPVYKMKNEWKLDIGLGGSSNNEQTSFSLSYIDYLRLLLLTVPSDVKLARIADLIQLNTSMWKTDFNILNAVTGVKAKAIFSENIIFPVAGIFPEKILMDDRRFRIYVEKYYEY